MEYGPVVVWLAASLLVGAAALPLSATVFRRFPDRGAGLSIPLGLSVLAVVGYLVGHLAFGAVALFAGAVVLVGASYLAGDLEAVDWQGYGESSAVFGGGFGLIVAVRASNPEIATLPLSAGEKFLDFGLLRTLLRTGALPPEDMWFAGEPLQYYYGGHLLSSLLTIGTTTDPAVAYNLSLAVFYGALVVGAYSLAGAIAAERDAPRRIAGLAAAFFVGLAGNLHTAAAVLAWLVSDRILVAVTPVAPDHPLLAWTPDRFFYWDASRIIDGTINEFPLFAWLNGDLHAHMMSTPFLLLVAACCFAYWRTPEDERRRRLGLLGLVTPIAGLIALTDTWSFPTAGGLVFLTVALAPADPGTLLPTRFPDGRLPDSWLLEELRRDGIGLFVSVCVLFVGGLWVAPFWLDSAATRGIGLFPDRSPLGGLLVVHGGFLLVFLPYLAGRVGYALETRRDVAIAAVAAGLFFLGAWGAGFAALGLFGPLLVAAWILLRLRADVGFETTLVLAGVGLVLIVEFAHVIDPGAPERLNTVFKVYMQTWILWSAAAGAVLARLADPSGVVAALDTPAWRTAGIAIACLAVVATGLYAGFALPAQIDGEPVGPDGPTLDGTAYLESEYPDEAAAIAWLDDRQGQPTIVTAAPGGYQWDPEAGEGASAPASLTGIPTVLGWHHQEQYRGTEPYAERLEDVTTIYEGSVDEQTARLDRYDVRYVYVGPAERTRYDLTIEDHPDLEVAFEAGEVVVYEYLGGSPGDR